MSQAQTFIAFQALEIASYCAHKDEYLGMGGIR